jgi:hypothetical protein
LNRFAKVMIAWPAVGVLAMPQVYAALGFAQK